MRTESIPSPVRVSCGIPRKSRLPILQHIRLNGIWMGAGALAVPRLSNRADTTFHIPTLVESANGTSTKTNRWQMHGESLVNVDFGDWQELRPSHAPLGECFVPAQSVLCTDCRRLAQNEPRPGTSTGLSVRCQVGRPSQTPRKRDQDAGVSQPSRVSRAFHFIRSECRRRRLCRRPDPRPCLSRN